MDYENNFINKVLIICCVCGGISKDAYMMLDGSKHSKENKISWLRGQGWLSKRIKGLDTLWQPEKNQELWQKRIPEEYIKLGIKTRMTIQNHVNDTQIFNV